MGLAMTGPHTSLYTVCGIEELGAQLDNVTHVLSLLDPDWPEPSALMRLEHGRRVLLRFHDDIQEGPGIILPSEYHVEAILAFGRAVIRGACTTDRHLLVHCHMGISRSTAAAAMLFAMADPAEDGDAIFGRVLQLRPKAWPNSRMIAFGDRMLARRGRLIAALGRVYAKRLLEDPELAVNLRANGRAYEVDLGMGAEPSDIVLSAARSHT